jgi:hypothetical protein
MTSLLAHSKTSHVSLIRIASILFDAFELLPYISTNAPNVNLELHHLDGILLKAAAFDCVVYNNRKYN